MAQTQNVDAAINLMKTIDHILSACPVLAPTEFTDRHNKVGQYIHWMLCKHYELPHEDAWWKHQPKDTVDNENCNDSVGFHNPHRSYN